MDRIIETMNDLSQNTIIIGILAFFGASFAGLTTQMKSGKILTLRSVAAAMLNSGFIGVIIFLLGYKMFYENLPQLLGMSIFAGIGGATVLDFFITILKKKGFSITIKGNE